MTRPKKSLQVDRSEGFVGTRTWAGGGYLRTDDIDSYYQWLADNNPPIHPNGQLGIKPWGQKEFSLLDPDHNLLTFGQAV